MNNDISLLGWYNLETILCRRFVPCNKYYIVLILTFRIQFDLLGETPICLVFRNRISLFDFVQLERLSFHHYEHYEKRLLDFSLFFSDQVFQMFMRMADC